MFPCPRCGEPLIFGAAACLRCGTTFDRPATAPPPTARPARILGYWAMALLSGMAVLAAATVVAAMVQSHTYGRYMDAVPGTPAWSDAIAAGTDADDLYFFFVGLVVVGLTAAAPVFAIWLHRVLATARRACPTHAWHPWWAYAVWLVPAAGLVLPGLGVI